MNNTNILCSSLIVDFRVLRTYVYFNFPKNGFGRFRIGFGDSTHCCDGGDRRWASKSIEDNLQADGFEFCITYYTCNIS